MKRDTPLKPCMIRKHIYMSLQFWFFFFINFVLCSSWCNRIVCKLVLIWIKTHTHTQTPSSVIRMISWKSKVNDIRKNHKMLLAIMNAGTCYSIDRFITYLRFVFTLFFIIIVEYSISFHFFWFLQIKFWIWNSFNAGIYQQNQEYLVCHCNNIRRFWS